MKEYKVSLFITFSDKIVSPSNVDCVAFSIYFKMEEEEDNNLQSNYENLLTHVVLPRVLPQQTSPDLWQQELDLLSHMSDNVQEMCEWLPPATVRLFESLKKIHMNIRPELVAEEIRMLEPGDTFGMFIRRQNCALMIHMPVEGNTNQPTELRNVIISTFPGNIHPKEVYGHSSDIQVQLTLSKTYHNLVFSSIFSLLEKYCFFFLGFFSSVIQFKH